MLRSVLPALLVLAIACGSRETAATRTAEPPAPRPEPRAQRREDPATADAVAAAVRSHEILTSLSVVPANSHVLCNAAMRAAAAAIGQPPEAMAWSGDGARDRSLLRTRIAGTLARSEKPLPADMSLRLARAMAMAARNAHVFAIDAGGMATLLALTSGQKAAGLGFSAHAAGGRWVIADVYPGSPAEAAGIQRGSYAVSLDGREFDEQSLIAMLLVSPGRRVALEIESSGPSPYRKLVELEAIEHTRPLVDSRVLEKGVGYLRIHYLPRSKDPLADAAVQVAGALADLRKKKVTKLVIDLRDDAGGSPFDVASLLVRGDPLLQGQIPGKPAEPIGRTAPSALAFKKPIQIAVLVNAQSYSAAEMVALALQAHGEARVFGQPTGGALTFPGQALLPGGITLFFPEGLVLDARGKAPEGQRVKPDEAIPSTTAQDIAAKRDPQLDAAVAWLKKQK